MESGLLGGFGGASLDDLRRLAREELDRFVVGQRVFRQTGVAAKMTLRGARVLVRGLLEGKTNPSVLFRFYAENFPTKTALVWRDQTWTFAELEDSLTRVAVGLRERGIGPGKGAVLMMKNRPEFVIVQPALGRLGGAAVSASWRSTPSELVYLVTHSGSKVVFFDSDVADVVRAALPDLPGLPRENFIAVGRRVDGFPHFDELLASRRADVDDQSNEGSVVIYTSGTTGKPKGAVRKFKKETTPAALRFIAETPMREDDVHLVTCPLYHSTAFGFVALSYALGATVVIMDEFKPSLFLAAVERHRVTQTAVVPTMLHRIMQLGHDEIRRYDTRSLRAVFSGGAPLPAPLAIEFMDSFGDILFNFYGSTETGLVTLAKPGDLRASPGTIGPALHGNEIRLLDDDGNEVKRGDVGELYVKNALLVEGYHHNAEATRDSIRDGFFSVGDLARKDARGCFHIEGRKRDMIISGGVNVYPAEVESVLEHHPDVAEVAVVGVADPEWGERVKAFVVLRRGATAAEQELRAYCREKLAGPKNPREYAFLDALPRNPTGKVLKRELREAKPG